MAYPNICAELHHMDDHERHMMARYISVTDELLVAVMQGEEELKPDEFINFKRYHDQLRYGVVYSFDYLLSPVLTVYDMRKRKHRHKLWMIWQRANAAERVADRNNWIFYTEVQPFSSLPRLIPRALVNKILTFTGHVEYIANNLSRKKPVRGLERREST